MALALHQEQDVVGDRGKYVIRLPGVGDRIFGHITKIFSLGHGVEQGQRKSSERAFSRTPGLCRYDSRFRNGKVKAMFKRITVAYNESSEASRALTAAIRLARVLDAELRAVTILEPPPAYSAFAGAADPSLTVI